MTEDTSSDLETDSIETGSERTDVETTAASSTYKVLGEFSDQTGAGVLGKNTADSGTPIGVQGAVPNATSDGYGLHTPHNARVGQVLDAGGALVRGDLVADRIDTQGNDFTVEAGTTTTDDAQNVVLGHAMNGANDGAVGATISGGGWDDGSTARRNSVYDNYGTIGGGRGNRAGNSNGDPTTDPYATVGGGQGNEATAAFATVGGGASNTAKSGSSATVAGGAGNTASGNRSTIPGGGNNVASGRYSFAAGRAAKTQTSGGTVHDGAFVWGDEAPYKVRSDAANQVVFQAGGGMKVYTDSDVSNNTGAELPSGSGSWTSLSTKTAKTNVSSVDSATTLERVKSLEITRWEYHSQGGVEHMGPMAEDFFEAFELGSNERRISTVDADGVALAAIQGLADQLDETRDDLRDAREELAAKDDRIDDQRNRIDDLRDENEDLRTETSDLRAENDVLRKRLTALEERVSAVEEPGEPAPVDD